MLLLAPSFSLSATCIETYSTRGDKLSLLYPEQYNEQNKSSGVKNMKTKTNKRARKRNAEQYTEDL